MAATFVIAPVLDRYAGGAATAMMVRVAVALASACAVVCVLAAPAQWGRRFWLPAAAACLAAGLVCGALYASSVGARTARFERARIAVGELKTDEETRRLIDVCSSLPAPNPAAGSGTGEALLWCASGDPGRFYRGESVAANFRLLTTLYVATAALLTAAFSASVRQLAGRRERARLRVFISYSRRDDEARAQLAAELRKFERIGFIESWYDGAIRPGEEWERQIEANLESADVIVLLVSADFLASEYCALEAARALERHRAGKATVAPIIVGPCDWQSAAFAKLQVIPRNGQPAPPGAWGPVIDELVEILQERGA
jgi:hypothetical protein